MKKQNMYKYVLPGLIVLIIALLVTNFNPFLTGKPSGTSLLVSAASSLKDVLEDIKPLYQKSQANISINYNFAASGALQRQIEQGAPADVFISAAKNQIEELAEKGFLVTETRTIIAKNNLVLVVGNNVINISSFDNLKDTKVKKIAIGEPRSVPAGQYAQQVLENMQLWQLLKSKLVYANNVRQVLAFVESENADAGLVYGTDAKISQTVKVVATADQKYHSPIIYPLAIIKSSKHRQAANNFAEFLSTNKAKAIFQKYGFIVAK